MESDFQPKIDAFEAPLKYTENLLTATNTLSIDPTELLTIGSILCSEVLNADTLDTNLSDHIQVNSNLSVAGNLFTNGNLDVDGTIICHDIKGRNSPFLGLYVAANGTIAANVGQVQTGLTSTIQSGNSYLITSTTPHPLGDNYLLMAMSRTTAGSNSFAMCTGVGAATTMTVWNRSMTNSIIAGAFYVYSIP